MTTKAINIDQFIAGLSDDEAMTTLAELVKRIWARSDRAVPIPIPGPTDRHLGYVIANDDSTEALIARARYRIAHPSGRFLDTDEFVGLLQEESAKESSATGS